MSGASGSPAMKMWWIVNGSGSPSRWCGVSGARIPATRIQAARSPTLKEFDAFDADSGQG